MIHMTILVIFFLISFVPVLWVNYVFKKNDTILPNMPFNAYEFGEEIIKEGEFIIVPYGAEQRPVAITDIIEIVLLEKKLIHNGSIKNAKEIINSAKLSGANAIKIQTYKPDTITLKHDSDEFKIIKECENGKDIKKLLEGPTCHSGFKRLN